MLRFGTTGRKGAASTRCWHTKNGREVCDLYPTHCNVLDPQRASTYCPNCNKLLIERPWHDLGVYALDQNRCRFCGHMAAGHFGDKPGHWGTRRLPVDAGALLWSVETDQSNTAAAGD